MRSVLLAALLLLGGCLSGPPPGPASSIVDSSFTEADNSRAIQLSMVLPASPAQVYRMLSTAQGWKTWAVASALGEIKFGGILETNYRPDALPGDPTSIAQQFVALVPNQLIAFRTIRTPEGFPHPELYMKTVASFLLSPEGSGTRLLFTHQGFGNEPGFDTLYDFFIKGDRETMESLRKSLGGK